MEEEANEEDEPTAPEGQLGTLMRDLEHLGFEPLQI
eukprot:CAMPEP_0170556638 /NCGR_PEP_ID=MMETSP0211-20121228/17885_1 /TAXON_ID=311385 /ORGANISM="Pseudokeronopsis sp., Strain OXSARD2" /LENGTH=35 /DNA_ID= /DNA_START= /DNA_END= /DNA_ORIENTATION=